MRRNLGRHAYGNTLRTIHQKIRNARGQHRGLYRALIVVGGEVHCFSVNIFHQRASNTRQAAFGVTHGRRRIVIHRTEVALAINERVAKRKILGHAHQGVIDSGIAMRMVLAHALAYDLGALIVLLVVLQAHLLHGVEHAPVHRLQSITHVGQCAEETD